MSLDILSAEWSRFSSMSLRRRSEAMLISAMINCGDAAAPGSLGVYPEMFSSRQAEYRWCLDYQRTYSVCPSPEALASRFPGFPYEEDKVDVAFYAQELHADHNERELVRTIKDAAALVSEGDVDEAVLRLGSYSPSISLKPLDNALHRDAFLDSYDEEIDRVKWPWRTLDEVTSGMRHGELYYLAARLGQGKSWTLASLICGALIDGRDVMMYSLEMSEEQVLTRIHVIMGQYLGFAVDHKGMRNRTFDIIQYRKLVSAMRDEIKGRLFIQDTSKGVISPKSLQGGQNKEVDLIVVDHAGLMHTGTGSRAVDDWRAAATISNQLKEVALGNHTRVLAAAQINREGDNSRSKRPPEIKHIAQSDALGQDADTVITHKRWGRSTMAYSIEKTRDGYSQVPFWTKFEPNDGVFTEISRDEAEERLEREELESE